MSWFRDGSLKAEDLDYDSFGCCTNQKLDPFKCVQCGLPFVYCVECSTVYPHLPDTSRFDDYHNATDPSRPSHRCQRCGYTFEYSFIRNRKYRVTRSEWVAAGLGDLLRDPDADDRPQLPPEIETIPWRAPWVPVKVSGVSSPQLAAEAGPKHVLHGRKAIAIGRRLDQDDFLFYLPDGPAMLAVVHLTYSRRLPEPNPEIPWTVLYKSVQEWIDQGLVPDAAELGNPGTQPGAATAYAETVSLIGGYWAIKRWLKQTILGVFLKPAITIERRRTPEHSRPDVSLLNRDLSETSTMELRSYHARSRRLVLVFSSDGGPRESESYVVSFFDVLLFHLPSVLHQQAFFRFATEDEARRLIPSVGFDAAEVAGKVLLLHGADGAALGYYVVAARASGGWESRRETNAPGTS